MTKTTGLRVVAAAFLLAGAAACDGLLEVRNPQRYTSEDLDPVPWRLWPQEWRATSTCANGTR